MTRAALVLSLALAGLGRLVARTPAGVPDTPQSGRVVSLVPDDGALLVDTERGPVLLLVTWDASIRGPHGVFAFKDIRTGDAVQWIDDGAQSVAMIDDLRVAPDTAR